MNADTIAFDGTNHLLQNINPIIDRLVGYLITGKPAVDRTLDAHRDFLLGKAVEPLSKDDLDGFAQHQSRVLNYDNALNQVVDVDLPASRLRTYCIDTEGKPVFFGSLKNIVQLKKTLEPYAQPKRWNGDLWELFPVIQSQDDNPITDMLHLAAIRIDFDKARERRAALEASR
ncbi:MULTISPECIES: hypothetical protein [unclassified Ruegeria]|uniref:hypothetical protein n=1 Tax=unclassified Ruegeria TaxID=2625375 RepID=UPI0014885982|nr:MULTISPECIES: hypothetical protein [unclassified Ruegeria]